MAYNEIIKLHKMLEKAKIPHEFEEHYLGFGGYHIHYPSRENRVCSAIEMPYSYGAWQGKDLIEIEGLTHGGDWVEGGLKAKEVFNRISEHYNGGK